MTTIANLTTEQAYLLKGRLEAEKIPVFILDEHALGGLPFGGNRLESVRIQVPDQHATEAQNILKAFQDSTATDEETESEPFVPRAKPILQTFEVIEFIGFIVFIVAILYSFLWP